MTVPGQVLDPTAVDSVETAIEVRGSELVVHVARPTHGAGHRGGLIVIHEAFGLNDHIRDLAGRFAGVGFDVVAPELYSRGGLSPGKDVGQLMAIMFALRDEDVLESLGACAAYLRALPTSNGRVGSVGFCAGGRHSLLMACSTKSLDASVLCWGGFLDSATRDERSTPARPTPVVDMVAEASCPVLLVGGEEDSNPSPALLRTIASTMTAAGRNVRLELFAGAGHAFLADYRDSYRPAAAFALWPDLVGFLTSTLND